MNFRRILSKSSLRSSTSGKSLNQLDEIKKLQDEIGSLKINVSSLKELLENRDAAIGTLAREKEKLYVEFKRIQRANRNLQQQLVDEREIFSKEKDFLVENMKRLSLKFTNSDKPNSILGDEEYISALQNEIESKNEVIYNVCSKYFKLKKSKEELQKKFITLQEYTQETFENVVTSLEDNKDSLDLLLDELRNSTKTTPSHKKYIKLLKINANLNFENTQLKLRLILKSNNDSKSIKENIVDPVISAPDCSRSENQFNVYKNLLRSKCTCCVEQLFRRSKTKTIKLVDVFSKFKNINKFAKYNKTIRYRSMSDTLLPRNFYK